MEGQLKPLVAERGKIKASMIRFKGYLDTFDSSLNPAPLKVRLEKLSPLFERFDAVQSAIEDLVARTGAEGAHVNERDDFETSCGELVGAAEVIIAQWQSKSNSGARNVTSCFTPDISAGPDKPRIKLPRIELPIFDGTYSQWTKFKDTFESLIHVNDALSNIEKFHYLNASLKGSAARVIQSLGVSEKNYELAWKALNDRFEDKDT